MIAVHLENGRVALKQTARPARPKGFALIRLLRGGICNTDLELKRGYHRFIGTPGHKFVGEVIESDNAYFCGRRVVGEINLACAKCEWCGKGLGRHCPNRHVLGIVRHPGAFREFLTLPNGNLHVVPDSVPTEHAVFVEPLAAACEILDQVEIPKGAQIAVLGDGKLGLLIAQVLRASEKSVHLFGRHKEKLRIAERRGIHTSLDRTSRPSFEYEWVVEATGSPEGLRQAIQMTRPRGTIFLKSTTHRVAPFEAAPVIVNELTLIGSRCGRFEPALNLLEQKKIDVDAMISETFPLSKAVHAFRTAQRAGVLKILLTGDQ